MTMTPMELAASWEALADSAASEVEAKTLRANAAELRLTQVVETTPEPGHVPTDSQLARTQTVLRDITRTVDSTLGSMREFLAGTNDDDPRHVITAHWSAQLRHIQTTPVPADPQPSDDRTARAIIDRLQAGEPWREVVEDYARVAAAPPRGAEPEAAAEAHSGALFLDIVRRTALALGKPFDGPNSSWHDIPEQVARLRERLALAQREIADLKAKVRP